MSNQRYNSNSNNTGKTTGNGSQGTRNNGSNTRNDSNGKNSGINERAVSNPVPGRGK